MVLDVELYRRTIYLPTENSTHVPRRISTIDICPEEAQATLVFVHGFGGSAMQWIYQLRFFGQQMRIIAPDIRGHGHSDDQYNLPYTMEGLVSDLKSVLDALAVQQPFWLIAHSFGGAIATEYALRYPDRLTGIVLIGVPSRFVLQPLLRWGIQRVPDPIFTAAGKLYGAALHAPQHTLKMLHDRVMSVWRGDTQLPLLNIPALVILGHRDTVFQREYYEVVPRTVPNSQRVVISVSAHLVQLERPDAVNRAIRRFIESSYARIHREHTHTDSSASIPSPATLFGNQKSALLATRLAAMPWLQYYDDGVPENIPPSPQLLHDLLSNAAQSHPHQAALIFFGQKIRYRELDLISNRFAHMLHALGMQHGERVAIVLPNIPQCVIAFYGTLKAGNVVVLGSPLSSHAELRHQLRDSGASVLLTLTTYRSQIEQMCSETQVRHVIYTDVREYLPLRQRLLLASLIEDNNPQSKQAAETQIVEHGNGRHPWHAHAFQQLLRRQPSTPFDSGVTAEQLALLQYTSGTTDTPKGVMLSHRNLVTNVIQVRHWIADAKRGQEVVLCVLPLSHAYGITDAMNIATALASTLVLLPTSRIEQVMDAIKRYRPSMLPGVPSLYLAIANYPHVRNYGVSAVRICISGSASLPVEVQEAFEKLTKGHLVEGYGLTEAAPVTHSNPLKGERRIGRIGLPLPGTQARIVDPQTDEPLPIGEIGELVVRGPQVMQGYWQMADETAQALRNGWLHTGDLARMDEDGFFTIVDRKKDLILTGPYNVYPRAVEEVLYEHPKVLEAVVVSANTTSPAYIKAFVVLKRGEQATADELLALCRERLDAYEVPTQIEFRHELPKNIVGKVLRRLLVEP